MEANFSAVLPLSERLRFSLEEREQDDLKREIRNGLNDAHTPKEDARSNGIASGQTEPGPSGPSLAFPFVYISASREHVLLRSDALYKEDAVDDAPGFLVQCDMDELTCGDCRYALDLDSLGQLSDGQVMAFLHLSLIHI